MNSYPKSLAWWRQTFPSITSAMDAAPRIRGTERTCMMQLSGRCPGGNLCAGCPLMPKDRKAA